MRIYIYVCICMNSYFMQFYSTVNALTYLTDQTRNKVHSSDYACEIDVDFIRAFDTIHQILLQKKKMILDSQIFQINDILLILASENSLFQ